MSNIDKINTNEQLFTDLTPEEGAVVEGGISFLLHGVYTKSVSQNAVLCLKFAGIKVFGPQKPGWNAEKTLKGVDFYKTTPLEFWHSDKWPNYDHYKFAEVPIKPTFQRRNRSRVKGRGYDYIAYFSVV